MRHAAGEISDSDLRAAVHQILRCGVMMMRGMGMMMVTMMMTPRCQLLVAKLRGDPGSRPGPA